MRTRINAGHGKMGRLAGFRYRLCLSLFLLLSAVAGSCAASDATTMHELEDVIEQITTSEGPFSYSLYPHLKLLGMQEFHAARYKKAIRIFQRMQNLVHRRYGVHASQQIESVDWLVETYLATGEFDLVNRLEEFRFNVAERNFNVDSKEMLGPTWRLATWYRNTHRYERALDLYRQTKELINIQQLPQADMINALRSEALTLYLSGGCCADQPLKNVAMFNHRDQAEQAEALLQLADMLFLLGKGKEAVTWAERAAQSQPHLTARNWQPGFLGFRNQRDVSISYLKAQIPDFNKPTRQVRVYAGGKSSPGVIGNPLPLCRQAVSNLIGIKTRNLDRYYVDVDLTVDNTGVVVDLNLEGNAPKDLHKYLLNSLKHAVYRPSIRNSTIPDETVLSFRQTFGANDDLSWGSHLNMHACRLIPSGR